MVDVPKEMEHQENLLAIKKRSPSFEAQDPLKEVNLGTNTNVRLTKISSFSADNDSIDTTNKTIQGLFCLGLS